MDKKHSNSEHITAATGSAPITGEDGRMDLTKSGKAYQIFDEMHKKDANVARKDCLERAVAEADMTPASAATFYQKWRDDNGMVMHRDGNQGNNTQPVEVKGPTIKNSAGREPEHTASKKAPAASKSHAKGATASKSHAKK